MSRIQLRGAGKGITAFVPHLQSADQGYEVRNFAIGSVLFPCGNGTTSTVSQTWHITPALLNCT